MRKIYYFIIVLLYVISVQAQSSRVLFAKMPFQMLQGVSECAYTLYLPAGYDEDAPQNTLCGCASFVTLHQT